MLTCEQILTALCEYMHCMHEELCCDFLVPDWFRQQQCQWRVSLTCKYDGDSEDLKRSEADQTSLFFLNIVSSPETLNVSSRNQVATNHRSFLIAVSSHYKKTRFASHTFLKNVILHIFCRHSNIYLKSSSLLACI